MLLAGAFAHLVCGSRLQYRRLPLRRKPLGTLQGAPRVNLSAPRGVLSALMARVTIKSPQVVAYLEELTKLGIYGSQPGAVATWIVRKEIMRLIEKKVIDKIHIVTPNSPADGDDEE